MKLHACVAMMIVAAIVLLSTSYVYAFDPPIDKTGPLTVKIEGPKVIEKNDAPLSIRVLFENSGQTPLNGTVRLGLIDDWRAEPAGEMQFTVPGKGSTARDVKVVLGPKTYNAWYPIHAYVKFELAGKQYTAHPILLTKASKLPERPAVTLPVE